MGFSLITCAVVIANTVYIFFMKVQALEQNATIWWPYFYVLYQGHINSPFYLSVKDFKTHKKFPTLNIWAMIGIRVGPNWQGLY